MAARDTFVCAMCGSNVVGATDALEAEGRWFCSREHRRVFDAGRTEPGRRGFKRAQIYGALIMVAVFTTIVVYQAVWGAKPQPAHPPVEHPV
jgi:hypothetical protein